MEKIGLVLEGGGMRGVFTAGVLHSLMENEIYFPYVIGVSAGACNGSSYISRQLDRNRAVNIDYATHPEYISFKRFLKNKELFGMDFLFDRLPNELVPFDFDTFRQAKEKFVVAATDCHTGDPVYFEKANYHDDMLTLLRASSSIPLIAPVVKFDGKHLLDGGIADPIPIQKSEQDGNVKNVIVLTRNKGYVKDKASFTWFIKRKFGHYKGLVEAILTRHESYNKTVEYIEEQEAKGNVFIIRPHEKLEVGRVERNQEKLTALYNQGFKITQNRMEELCDFIGVENPFNK